jgi:hypothetical protein
MKGINEELASNKKELIKNHALRIGLFMKKANIH